MKGKHAATRASTPKRDAHRYIGTGVAVLANVAMITATMPISLFSATAVPFPVAR